MNNIEERILNTLKQYHYGLTISELSRIIKVNRITLSKHLEILRERGYIGYRNVGKAKVWYINEDINFLELVYSDNEINKLLRKNEEGFYNIVDVSFIIVPSELLQVIYLELSNISLELIRNIGKKFGITIAALYKIYSGNKGLIKEENVEKTIRLYQKFGFGKISNVNMNLKDLEFHIIFSSLLESNIIKDSSDILNKQINKDYFTEGYFEGFLSTLFGLQLRSVEIKSLIDSDSAEFVIKRI